MLLGRIAPPRAERRPHRLHQRQPILRPSVISELALFPSECHAATAVANTGSMEDHSSPSGPIDLDALDDYLMSDHAPDESMGLSDLDGFLTGIVVGPELILPSEWLPVIWGGEEPEFETETEMRTVLGTIMSRYNEIVACFNSDPEEFGPIFWEGPEGEVIASDWAGGFLDAVALRPKAWEPLIKHRRGRMMMMPLLLLNGGAEIDAGPDGAADEERFLAEVPDIIPACVAAIYQFWRNHQKPTSSRSRSRPGGSRRR
jgi:uncharacterized protein